ncbi:MAG TPA: DUF4259 domain-containing protein [Gemmataceae bacterium]|nr:DUF4259 domain-containing protein [Gemmataceae bacterium]
MGVWGAGNFANDEALDYAHELVDRMIEQVESTVASEHGMEPDEPDSFRLMCNIELMCLIGQYAGLSMPEAKKVKRWKKTYLAVWDGYIDGLDPKPGFKEERRAVIVQSFDRLIAFCKSQEQ